jgi:cation:H+ antiporter
MVYVTFVVTAALIVFAATQLARYGDIIAVRTRLGGMFIGVLLLATATSLPEVLTSINSLNQNVPDLAAGNLLGSNTFNMLLLAVVDIVGSNQRILRKTALKHALTGSLAVMMIGLVVFFVLADIDVMVGWIGLDALLIMAAYVVAVRLIQSNLAHVSPPSTLPAVPQGTPSLRRGLIGFVVAAGALVAITPIMVASANEIAVITGLGATFVGTSLVALVTSLPELVTTLAAIRIGAADMAIGNLFGSNMFNMFAVGLTDVFFTQGRFLAVIDPAFLLVGMIGLLMTGMGLIGNLVTFNRRLWVIEVDGLALMGFYFGSLWLLYIRN